MIAELGGGGHGLPEVRDELSRVRPRRRSVRDGSVPRARVRVGPKAGIGLGGGAVGARPAGIGDRAGSGIGVGGRLGRDDPDVADVERAALGAVDGFGVVGPDSKHGRDRVAAWDRASRLGLLLQGRGPDPVAVLAGVGAVPVAVQVDPDLDRALVGVAGVDDVLEDLDPGALLDRGASPQLAPVVEQVEAVAVGIEREHRRAAGRQRGLRLAHVRDDLPGPGVEREVVAKAKPKGGDPVLALAVDLKAALGAPVVAPVVEPELAALANRAVGLIEHGQPSVGAIVGATAVEPPVAPRRDRVLPPVRAPVALALALQGPPDLGRMGVSHRVRVAACERSGQGRQDDDRECPRFHHLTRTCAAGSAGGSAWGSQARPPGPSTVDAHETTRRAPAQKPNPNRLPCRGTAFSEKARSSLIATATGRPRAEGSSGAEPCPDGHRTRTRAGLGGLQAALWSASGRDVVPSTVPLSVAYGVS